MVFIFLGGFLGFYVGLFVWSKWEWYGVCVIVILMIVISFCFLILISIFKKMIGNFMNKKGSNM